VCCRFLPMAMVTVSLCTRVKPTLQSDSAVVVPGSSSSSSAGAYCKIAMWVLARLFRVELHMLTTTWTSQLTGVASSYFRDIQSLTRSEFSQRPSCSHVLLVDNRLHLRMDDVSWR
jgi:hypothetical protein